MNYAYYICYYNLSYIFIFVFQGCDAAYLTNIHSEFETNPDFVKPTDRRRWDKEFGIRHYAGTVIYTVNGFVDKNRDAQQDVFFDLLAKSKTKFVVNICEYRDLLSKVAQLGAENGGGSISKGIIFFKNIHVFFFIIFP